VHEQHRQPGVDAEQRGLDRVGQRGFDDVLDRLQLDAEHLPQGAVERSVEFQLNSEVGPWLGQVRDLVRDRFVADRP